jgi:hypothetical protein
MEVIETYQNLAERQQKITLREGQSLRMLHDNFDATWERGDEPHGVMTFTDVPSPIARVDRDIVAELDELKVKVATMDSKIVAMEVI